MAKTSGGKIAGYIIAGILIFFGVLFIWSAGAAGVNTGSRLLTGIVLIALGLGIILLVKIFEPKEPQKVEITQKIEVSGDVSLEQIKCRNCGGTLSKESVTVKEGAIFVNCPYCGTSYQIEESPKW
ncbi:MAG: hypothetical protein AB1393_05585 [Candidatus Edwardsbacteria bacterium]